MSFAHLLVDEVRVASETGRDGYGGPTFGSVRTLKACIVYGEERILTIDGEEKVSSVTVDTAEPILRTDRVWLPGESTTSDPGRVPLSIRNMASPRSGLRLHQTFL